MIQVTKIKNSKKVILLFMLLIVHLTFNIENCMSQETWTPTSTTNAPPTRYLHTAVWSGSKMIVWGGTGSAYYSNTGGIYNPLTDIWLSTSLTNVPTGRQYHTAVWAGSKMIIWGGDGSSYEMKTGATFDPETNTWTPTTLTNAPAARTEHVAVWTGSKMIIWGGFEYLNATYYSNGSSYNPSTDTWTPISSSGAPIGRRQSEAIWTGSKMIVWGGHVGVTTFSFYNTGGIYDTLTNTWTETSLSNAPIGRSKHSLIWTGTKMIVWGGWRGSTTYTNTGGIFDPVTNTWTTISTTNAPTARGGHVAVWTGNKMIVWGGRDGSGYFSDGYIYDPQTDTWTGMSAPGAPSGRSGTKSVWTGTKMIIWGGYSGNSSGLNTGGVYYNPAIIPSIHDMSVGPFMNLQLNILVNTPVTVKTKVSNLGTLNENSIPVKFYVNGNLINTTNINLVAGQVDSVSNIWTPTTSGSYNLMYVATAPVDTNRLNDTVRVTVNVILTGITSNYEIPVNFSIAQNYPNPFNPVTKINYDIPKQSLVTLKIFDVAGREVRTLVSEIKTAGSYSVDFNAGNLSSGIYFYKLSVGEYTETKKMLLVK